MIRNTKIVIGIMALGAVGIGIIGYFASVRRAHQTMATTATVVSARWEKKTGKYGKDKVLVTVSYSAGTRQPQGKIRMYRTHPDLYPAGRSVSICYDPENLTSIRERKGACG